MPLSVSVTDASGVVSTYWAISNAQADFGNETCSIALVGYLSADAYATKKAPSSRGPFLFTVPFSEIPSVSSGSIAMSDLYDALVAQINDPERPASPLTGATLVA